MSPGSGPVEHPEPSHHRQRRGFLDATEMYLRVLYELEEEYGDAVRPVMVSRRTGASRPTVRENLERMAGDGLLARDARRGLVLTDRGRRDANVVVRKHRLAEVFLVDVIGLGWELVHAEASRWQHVIGARTAAKLADRIGHPATSPFGCPIPGGSAAPAPGTSLLRVVDTVGRAPSEVVIRRVPERLQTDVGLLARMREIGALPGARVEVARHPTDRGAVRLETATGAMTLPALSAGGLLVDRERRGRPTLPHQRPRERETPWSVPFVGL